jgi:nucleoside-diphosphate-sugar epimerase
MKKVLLVGGSGYVGRYVAYHLAYNGVEVKIFDRTGPGDGYPSVVGDIRNTKAVVAAASGYDVIVILAGIVGDSACNADKKLADEVNHLAVRDICEKIRHHKHIILMSTCAVYGAQNDILHEGSSVNPLSVYSQTKLDAESHVTGVGGTIFRLGSVYGIGADDHIRMDSIVNLFVCNAVKNGVITVYGGDQWKSLVSVKDVAAYIFEAITKNIKGLFNVSLENLTVKEIAVKVQDYTEAEVIIEAPLPHDRNYFTADNKLRFYFTHRNFHYIDHEIPEMVEFFKTHM